jgi:hypothetical protein
MKFDSMKKQFERLEIYLPILALVGATGCAPITTLKQIQTSSATERMTLDKPGEWVSVPFPVLVTTGDKHSTLTALVVAECAAGPQVVQPAPSDPTQLLFGKTTFVRIAIDGAVADPGEAALSTSPQPGTHSYLAVAHGILPGSHQVWVQCKSTEAHSWLGTRTLTVWQADEETVR